MKQRGFTLIELMVGIIFMVCLGIMVIGALGARDNAISWGINGMTESRCIEGYKFIIDQKGNSRQILDEFGKGVRCEKATTPGF
jgi:hypothetical protein